MTLISFPDCSHPDFCHNGGTCVPINSQTNYNCNCAPGWYGDSCQLVGKKLILSLVAYLLSFKNTEHYLLTVYVLNKHILLYQNVML